MAAQLQLTMSRMGQRFYRFLNTTRHANASGQYLKKLAKEEKHADGTLVNWKRISLFIALPTCSYLFYRILVAGSEEHPDPDSYVPYSHLHIRNKLFPWGKGGKSLFHNPHANFGVAAEEAEHEGEAEEQTEEMPFITRLLVDYIMSDPTEDTRKRETHMRTIRTRCDEYLERKRRGQHSMEPMDLDKILSNTNRPTEWGVDGY